MEQSLVINLENRGLVIIIGCGHPTIQQIIHRARKLFPDIPLYGIIGGLHYPVTFKGSRRLIGSGRTPWNPINRSDVAKSIAFIKAYNPGVVSVSPHDSCEWTINTFREAFGEACIDLLVGKEIKFS
jgi:7,8-dihydropterin-6-yl-methyl-4-(beta-D-ribofuranosyl)aminobenzene 5'-phosphate synthase